MQAKIVEDSGFDVVHCGFCIPHQWIPDSEETGFQILMKFRSAKRGVPDFSISSFPDSVFKARGIHVTPAPWCGYLVTHAHNISQSRSQATIDNCLCQTRSSENQLSWSIQVRLKYVLVRFKMVVVTQDMTSSDWLTFRPLCSESKIIVALKMLFKENLKILQFITLLGGRDQMNTLPDFDSLSITH